MQKERDCLQIDLKSAEAQIDTLLSQNFAKDLELQWAKAKFDVYDSKYKRDPKVKQQHEKHRRVQKDYQNKIIQWK